MIEVILNSLQSFGGRHRVGSWGGSASCCRGGRHSGTAVPQCHLGGALRPGYPLRSCETAPMAAFRVTYATLSADDDELQASYDAAVETARYGLGAFHPLRIGTEECICDDTFATRSPIDREVVVGVFAEAAAADVDDAVTAAAEAFDEWSTTPWRERVAILDRVADLISERSVEHAAHMAWENGKNRLEALGEVEEAADLIRYYTHAMVEHDGFDVPMQRFSEAEATSDVMRPYGVWGVIAPFNYPAALVAGPAGAALVAGNTVVIKPSEIGSLCGHLIYDAFVDGGVPPRRRQPRDRSGRPGRRGARRRQPPRRAHVHRLQQCRDVDHQVVLVVASASGDLRDGWQEPGDRRLVSRSRPGGRRHGPIGVRVRGPEVLGRLAGVRPRVARRRVLRSTRRPRRGDPAGRPARPRRLPVARRRRGRGRALRAGRRRRQAHRRRAVRRDPPHRRRSRSRQLPRAHCRSRARRLDDLGHRAVRAAHRRPFRRRRSTRRSNGPTPCRSG